MNFRAVEALEKEVKQLTDEHQQLLRDMDEPRREMMDAAIQRLVACWKTSF